jgi:hypothetical protein
LLGASLASQKKYAEAEALLISGYMGMMEMEATTPAFEDVKIKRAGEWIVQLYQDWGKPAEAAEWQGKVQRTQRVEVSHSR